MKFPYVRYKVPITPATPDGVIFRPEIPVVLAGSSGEVKVRGLIDTGADHVFISSLLAPVLGVELIDTEASEAEGAGSERFKVVPGRISLLVSDDGSTCKWDCGVGFIDMGEDDSTAVYLGHAGFLDRFVVTFDSREHVLELVPRSDLDWY